MPNIEEGFEFLLKCFEDELGLDLSDENLIGTPKRVANAYKEIFSGVSDTKYKINEVLKSKFPSTGYDQMIVSLDVSSYSMCPHHFLPVSYSIDVGYVPSEDGYVLGISKLARVGEILSSRPVLQETLTFDIGKALEKIKPLGVAVRVQGTHLCMKMRGVKKKGFITTSYMSGIFRDEPSARQEFLSLVCSGRRELD